MNRTFVAIKPDGVKRKLVGEIIKRFEQVDFNIVALKMINVSQELAEKHYEEHKYRDFYQGLMEFFTSGPIVTMVLEGADQNIISITRKLIGPTNSPEAPAGTIRGDFSQFMRQNLIHASDSVENADREIKLYFPEL